MSPFSTRGAFSVRKFLVDGAVLPSSKDPTGVRLGKAADGVEDGLAQPVVDVNFHSQDCWCKYLQNLIEVVYY